LAQVRRLVEARHGGVRRSATLAGLRFRHRDRCFRSRQLRRLGWGRISPRKSAVHAGKKRDGNPLRGRVPPGISAVRAHRPGQPGPFAPAEPPVVAAGHATAAGNDQPWRNSRTAGPHRDPGRVPPPPRAAPGGARGLGTAEEQPGGESSARHSRNARGAARVEGTLHRAARRAARRQMGRRRR
jgi:hypothetical protein